VSEKVYDLLVRPSADEADGLHQTQTFNLCLDVCSFGPVTDHYEPDTGMPLEHAW
jgi:hypothetical protein